MNHSDSYQKIFQYLIESQPEKVENIIAFRRSNKKYPDFVSEFIINLFKDKPDLHTIFRNLEESISCKDQFYDLIFNSLVEDENLQITDNENANAENNDENEIQQDDENIVTEEESTEFNDEDNNFDNYQVCTPSNDDDDDDEVQIGTNDSSSEEISLIISSDDVVVVKNDETEIKITSIDDEIIDIKEFHQKQQSMIDYISKILFISKDVAFFTIEKAQFQFRTNYQKK